MNTDAVMACVH